MPEARAGLCVCGKAATVPVVVHWKDGDRTYRYCPECALDVCAMEGTELAWETK